MIVVGLLFFLWLTRRCEANRRRVGDRWSCSGQTSPRSVDLRRATRSLAADELSRRTAGRRGGNFLGSVSFQTWASTAAGPVGPPIQHERDNTRSVCRQCRSPPATTEPGTPTPRSGHEQTGNFSSSCRLSRHHAFFPRRQLYQPVISSHLDRSFGCCSCSDLPLSHFPDRSQS